MTHEMKLDLSSFKGIKEKKQKYETRLFDEKRRTINIGDTIIFRLRPELIESIETKVITITKAKDFEELYTKIKPLDANWPSNFSPSDCAKSMLRYYSIEDTRIYGAVAFGIEPISK